MNDADVSKLLINPDIDQLSQIEYLDKDDLVEMVKKMVSGGVSLSFFGKRTASEIERRVKPRQTQIIRHLSIGTESEQKDNALIEGENLQALVTLYKYRGQVDLILTDPPYNTGEDFRYNDKWDTDPNDPDLGLLVAKDDGARHTKWMKAMLPRLKMMKRMLKPSGVLAICIDHRELFRLGMLMNEVFGEENRIGIINWQKTFSPKNDSKHLSTATEYVLIYAKAIESATTNLLPREEERNKSFANPDNDIEGSWAGKDPTASGFRTNTDYAIQSPFTGNLHYPDLEFDFTGDVPKANKHWTGIDKKDVKASLEKWGVPYIEKDLGDGRKKALIIKGSSVNLKAYDTSKDQAVITAKETALRMAASEGWVLPKLYFNDSKQGGKFEGRPRIKNYLKKVKQGKVAITFWAQEDYDTPLNIEAQSWGYEDSGHSQAGVTELDAIMGKQHNFRTVKPLKLFKKIIHLWCPPNGLILDPYAGSGTTGHAVLELNNEVEESNRNFIIIEQGAPEKGDKYAKTLTYERLRRVISGERVNKTGKVVKAAPPLKGGFRFQLLKQAVDARAVLAMKKDELIDIVIVSHWDETKRKATLERINDDSSLKYLVGKNGDNNGYFVIWNGGDAVESFTQKAYATIVQEAKKYNLVAPYYVYARNQLYQSKTVVFHKIPDKILAHLGLNESSDSYNLEEDD